MLCTDNNVVLLLNFFQLPNIDKNLFKTFLSSVLSMKNGFTKVQKNISREETVNIDNFTG